MAQSATRKKLEEAPALAPPIGADLAFTEWSREAVSHNLNGQKLGRKGRVTRERILAATSELLSRPDDVPISLSAVARQASLGMTSLYNYFADLTELLIALLEPVMESAEAYLSVVREPWPDDELEAHSLAFVRAMLGYWEKNWRLLHMRNRMVDQRDERMTRLFIQATRPVIQLLVKQMGGDPAEFRGRDYATASVVMIGIEKAVDVATDRQLPRLLAEDTQHDRDHFLVPGARMIELAIRDRRARNGLRL